MRPSDTRGVMPAAIVLLACLAIVVIGGCAKRESELSTRAVTVAAALPIAGFKGDVAYATVRSTALPALYDNFRDVLSRQGLVKWDERYDCNHFAALYVALAQTQFAVAAWHSTTPAQTLALAEVWFVPGGAGAKGHAIVAAVTERGLLFIEPQTGAEIQLNERERRSIYLCKW